MAGTCSKHHGYGDPACTTCRLSLTSDATGLSEGVVKEIGETIAHYVSELIASHAALAERLKASEANLLFCPQAHTIYVEGGRTTDVDIPCPHCERDQLTADLVAAQAERLLMQEEAEEVASQALKRCEQLEQSNARLTAALEALVGCPNMTANINAAKAVGLDHLKLAIPITEIEQAQAALVTEPPDV